MDKVPTEAPRLKLVRVTSNRMVVRERRHPDFGARVGRFAAVGLLLYLEERALELRGGSAA